MKCLDIYLYNAFTDLSAFLLTGNPIASPCPEMKLMTNGCFVIEIGDGYILRGDPITQTFRVIDKHGHVRGQCDVPSDIILRFVMIMVKYMELAGAGPFNELICRYLEVKVLDISSIFTYTETQPKEPSQ